MFLWAHLNQHPQHGAEGRPFRASCRNSKNRIATRIAIPFLATCSKHEAPFITQVNQSWVLFKQQAFSAIGEDHFLSPKSQCVHGPENEIAVTVCEKCRGTQLLIEGLYCSSACMLPIFAKAPCCLKLFWCCCRRLSQHGVDEDC